MSAVLTDVASFHLQARMQEIERRFQVSGGIDLTAMAKDAILFRTYIELRRELAERVKVAKAVIA